MPRIDPIQLLNCLSVLLSPHGGIKSRDEVQRLAHLMTKFSKKLVSKCIYVQILKCTETDLLGLFMGSGGWMLVHTWLTESIVIKNWPLVRELLELLLLCPVDIERLKTNNCPKLVKELSKDGNHFAIRALASKLVEQWLKIVKGERVVPVSLADLSHIISDSKVEDNPEKSENNEIYCDQINTESNLTNIETKIKTNDFQREEEDEDQIPPQDKIESEAKIKNESPQETEGIFVLKFTLKDGKQVVSTKVDDNDKLSDSTSDSEKTKEKHKSRSKEKSSERSSSSSSSKSSSKHSGKQHSSSDKHKSSHKSSSSSSSSRHNSKDKKRDKSSHSSKSKSDSSRKSSDKSSSSSVKSKDEKNPKSTSEKDKKEKENKDKNDKNKSKSNEKSEDKPQVASIHKLGKIPKLSDVKREKPSISIEVRKPDEPKPKTVKTFHSKFRKHGLEEEVKPPPSRASLLSKKVPPALPPTVAIPKRPSPVHTDSPPEKKHKPTEIVEKPGAIKLIPPKPKRSTWCSLILSTGYNKTDLNFFGD